MNKSMLPFSEFVTNFGALAKRMIKFINNDARFSFRQKTVLKQFIGKLLKREGKTPGEISYIFCSDEYLLQMNRQFLKHDYYTDIITFDLSEGDRLNAEVYISVDRVRENAKTLQEPLRAELLRVIFHGALHLCGYGDKTKREITIMREKENEYLKRFEKENPL